MENWSKLALTVTVYFMEVKIASCTFSQAKTRDILASHADVLRGSPGTSDKPLRTSARQARGFLAFTNGNSRRVILTRSMFR